MSLIYGRIAAYATTLANTYQVAYTVPASNRFVGQILIVNTAASTGRSFRIAIVGSAGAVNPPDPESIIFYDLELLPQESMTISGVTLGAGERVVIYTDHIADTAQGTGIIMQMHGEIDDNV